jgi:hypothetical protein
MKTNIITQLILLFACLFSANAIPNATHIFTAEMNQLIEIYPQNATNGCVSFTVGSGTGCAWMCSYCAANLGTNNYYFVDGVCQYQPGGCVGNPVAGKQYTCCAANLQVEIKA